MKSLKSIWLGLALAGLVSANATADVNDAWLTTKAKISLLTTEGVSVVGVNVDTVNGAVTLHGKVKTQAEKDKATAAVRGIEGVRSVNNLLQVVPEAFKDAVEAKDDVIKDRIQAALKADSGVSGVRVASVNKGVVLLSGSVVGLNEKLRAIELAADVDGVRRVASEITVDKK